MKRPTCAGSDGEEKVNISDKVLYSGKMRKDCGMIDDQGALHIPYVSLMINR